MSSCPAIDRNTEEFTPALEDLVHLARSGVPGCSEASVTVLHDGHHARTMASTSARPVAVDESQFGAGAGPCLSAIRDGETVAVPNFDTDTRWPNVTAQGRQVGLRSSVSLPLADDREVLGSLNLYGNMTGAFGEDSRHAAKVFARQALILLRSRQQLHVERAQHAQERPAAATLQQFLLPTVPDLPGITAAARYLVSSSPAQVGGDWCDVFALPDGAVGVAIGDVMGHDTAAAAGMAQLRSVLRSYAYQGSSPSTVLDRMDRLVQGFAMVEVATAIYGRLILDHGVALFLFSNAGHLPPLVRHPDGHVERLDRGSHHLIGAMPPSESRRGEAATTLADGAVLVLYTDGLVETRIRTFDDGIGLLSAALAALDPDLTPTQACDTLLNQMISGDPEDDVALLLIRINP